MKLMSAGILAAVLLHTTALAAPDTEELERWFQSDEPGAPGESVAHVSDGELSFLETAAVGDVHHHHNALSLPASSLRDGWVRLEQCHANLDPVGRVQITFREGRVRDLVVRSTQNVGAAWVEGASVQLRDVRRNARICLEAWTRALQANADGSYTLRNGPFMRKFLDGYYPMRVSMDLDYGDAGLNVVGVAPPAQQGFEVSRGPGELVYDAVFEGRLVTEITFRRAE